MPQLSTDPSDPGFSPLRWDGQVLWVVDQRALPAELRELALGDVDAVIGAIRSMAVRGAPAIGIVAAYGAVLAARARVAADPVGWRDPWRDDLARIGAARPTAVNLRWALERMQAVVERTPVAGGPHELEREARALQREDLEQNRAMGHIGAALIAPGSRVLTHCNTGALATAGWGTALGVIRSAWMGGRISGVFATETRPWLQGARLTVWELARDAIPVTLIVDSAAAATIRDQGIGWVVVGADRIAANGDVANKVGTYGLALIARALGARLMVVAPSSTVDMALANGGDIPIEDRGVDDVWRATGTATPPAGVAVANPVFDVTPAVLVDVLVTERGAIERPDRTAMQRAFGNPGNTIGTNATR